MRKTILACFSLLFCPDLPAQETVPRITNYLQEISDAGKQYQGLWARNLYGPVLFVDPATRQLIANYPDTAGQLKPAGELFTGFLPPAVNIANTAVVWGGRRWAMLMLPLPADKKDRLNLLAHELFHLHQPALGFSLYNPDNNHLDRAEGRIYLRLELEALLQAIQAGDTTTMRAHLQHALGFRAYRHSLYAGSDSSENKLELNEGMAEYTGLVMGGRDHAQTLAHFNTTTKAFVNSPGFVRSFAYHTVPMYGYLLARVNHTWNKEITPATDLTAYFMRSFAVRFPADMQRSVEQALPLYNGQAIITQEKTREAKQLDIVAGFKKQFLEQPHLDITFEKMNVSFDPGNIIPLEDKGTVYPVIRVTDNWGILSVTKGALMAPNWNRLTITPPLNTAADKITGEGWTLEPNPAYHIIKTDKGNFQLVKK